MLYFVFIISKYVLTIGHIKDPNLKCLMKLCIEVLSEDFVPYCLGSLGFVLIVLIYLLP